MLRALIVLGLVLLSGCATPGPTHEQILLSRIQQKYDSEVGVKTYDSYLSELGQPSEMTNGNDIFVAEWVYSGGYEQTVVSGNSIYSFPVRRETRLRLTFDKETQLLSDWRLKT